MLRRALLLVACLLALATPARGQQQPTPPAAPAKPVRASITSVSVQNGRVTVTIDRGVDAGVAPGWKGTLLSSSGKALPAIKLSVIRATELTCTAVVTSGAANNAGAMAMIKRYPKVELAP